MTRAGRLICTLVLAGLLSLAFFGALAPTPVAQAQTFTVTKTDDTADGVCDTDCSLREAIIAANASEGPDTIVLGPGHYLLTLSGSGEDNSATGDLDIFSDVTLQGAGAAQTIIDAGGFAEDSRDRVLHVRWAGGEVSPTVTIMGITVQNGVARGHLDDQGGGLFLERSKVIVKNTKIIDSSASNDGGGIALLASDVQLLNSTVQGNDATEGGGIFVWNPAQSLFLQGSLIENNTANGIGNGGFGGGIQVAGARSISITNSQIRNNTATRSDTSGGCGGSHGGGLAVGNVHQFALIDSEVSGNIATGFGGCTAPIGGGIIIGGDLNEVLIQNSRILSNTAVEGGGIVGYAKIVSSTISYNRATGENENDLGGHGGGIFPSNDTEVIGSIISHNYAARTGGGIGHWAFVPFIVTDTIVEYNTSDMDGGGIHGEVNLVRTTVRNNAARNGGGVYWINTSTITDSTISGNTASEEGGGIYTGPSYRDGPNLLLQNSTISGNSAKKGGGINQTAINPNFCPSDTRLTVINSTIADNTSTVEGAGIFYKQNCDGFLKLTNTLLADNDGPNCAGDVNNITSLGHNLSDDGFCLFTGAGDQVKVDAKLGPLQDNGGPSTGSGQATLTHALLDGSPAINAGDDAACPATDQRGVFRPQGPRCDIGAFEAEVTTPYLFVTPALLEFYAVAGATPPSAKAFTVENSGVGVLNWSASESTSWLILDKSSGTAPMTVSVAISTTDLNPGSYNADVTVSAAGAGGSPQTVAVSLTVAHAGSLLLNGDFELGRKSWSESSLKSRALIRQGNDVPYTSPRSGVWAAVLGQVDGEISQLSQRITLPDGDDLSLIYYTFGHSTESQCDAEVARVRIDGQEVAAHPLCQANNSVEWAMHEIDLNAYRGKEVSLQFYLANDPTSDPSTLLIDDVRLQLGDQPPPQTKWDIFLPAVQREEPPVTAECTPSPAGDGNTPGDALTICHDQTVSGHVDQSDYWDVYKIAIDANRAIAISLTGGPGDANMRLYPPGTTSIDEGFLAEWSTSGGTSNESIQGTTLVAGEWFVVVYAWEGASDYQLKVTIGESIAPTSCEPSPPGDSNNVDDALTLCPGQPVSGQVDRNSDMWDVYRVAYADNTATIIELSGQGGNAQMGLYGPSATNVLTDNPVRTSVNPGNDERINGIIRDPGGWYIAVVNIEDSTDYTLRVTNTFIVSNSRKGSAQNAKEKESALDGPAIHPTQRVQWYE